MCRLQRQKDQTHRVGSHLWVWECGDWDSGQRGLPTEKSWQRPPGRAGDSRVPESGDACPAQDPRREVRRSGSLTAVTHPWQRWRHGIPKKRPRDGWREAPRWRWSWRGGGGAGPQPGLPAPSSSSAAAAARAVGHCARSLAAQRGVPAGPPRDSGYFAWRCPVSLGRASCPAWSPPGRAGAPPEPGSPAEESGSALAAPSRRAGGPRPVPEEEPTRPAQSPLKEPDPRRLRWRTGSFELPGAPRAAAGHKFEGEEREGASRNGKGAPSRSILRDAVPHPAVPAPPGRSPARPRWLWQRRGRPGSPLPTHWGRAARRCLLGAGSRQPGAGPGPRTDRPSAARPLPRDAECGMRDTGCGAALLRDSAEQSPACLPACRRGCPRLTDPPEPEWKWVFTRQNDDSHPDVKCTWPPSEGGWFQGGRGRERDGGGGSGAKPDGSRGAGGMVGVEEARRDGGCWVWPPRVGGCSPRAGRCLCDRFHYCRWWVRASPSPGEAGAPPVPRPIPSLLGFLPPSLVPCPLGAGAEPGEFGIFCSFFVRLGF